MIRGHVGRCEERWGAGAGAVQEQQEQLALSCVMARSHDIRDGTAGGAFFF